MFMSAPKQDSGRNIQENLTTITDPKSKMIVNVFIFYK